MWLSILLAVANFAERTASWIHRSERELVDAVLSGSEEAATWLVRKHWGSMMRVATNIVRSESIAAEVVQEAWEAVFKNLRGFRGESSLSTWIFRILVNRARRVGKKESKSIPFSGMAKETSSGTRPDFEDEFTSKGHWQSPVHGWSMCDPQTDLINQEGLRLIAGWLDDLPKNQRLVLTMRDIQGMSSEDTSEILDISASNQRQLLHRARTYLRRMLEKEESRTISAAAEGAM